MNKGILITMIVLAGIVGLYFFFIKRTTKEPATVPPIVKSQHSDTFNEAVNGTLTAYAALTEAFIDWDTAAVNKGAVNLNQKLEAIQFDELKKDANVYKTATTYVPSLQNDLKELQKQKDITGKRKAFSNFSASYYDLLRTIHYDAAPVYLQECPMAFNNETEAGQWLSREEAIRNPYMGLHHPKYGKAMMECGETKDSIHFNTATMR